MQLYSTNGRAEQVNFEKAIFRGLPEDNGLYLPIRIPALDQEIITRMPDMSFQEIAFEVSRLLLGDEIPEEDVWDIIQTSMNFPVVLNEVVQDRWCLELFHGPSLAFKDFGARFMAACMSYFLTRQNRSIHILVATSGDTGSAVAQGFYQMPGIKVTILYPSGKVSPTQEKQLTTLGHNITALEVDGVFDDCQRLVKEAFLDSALSEKLGLSSANSINIARLIPQSFYYFEAYARLADKGKPLVFSTPSGNFGNLCGGVLAHKMGLPVDAFVAATNINDVVPEYLKTGQFIPRASVATLSNAMDVGNPSNFPRLLNLLRDGMPDLIKGYAFDDASTLAAMKALHGEQGYIACPHTAIAYLGLEAYRRDHNKDITGVFLGTAHPAKFSEVVLLATGRSIPLPEALSKANALSKQSIPLPIDFEAFKDHLNKSHG